MGRADAIAVVGPAGFIEGLRNARRPYHDGYYAMYNGALDAVVTAPELMLVPFDDHMVHRGDGVFEVFRLVDGAFYNLHAHLERLARSARPLALRIPCDRGNLIRRIAATACAGGRRDATVRVNIGRGPGGFGADPAESPESRLYIAVYRTPPPFMRRRPEGARAIRFSKPMRHFVRPVIKSCNYLFNALMKMEARARGADFAIACDENGCLAEGATESAACVTRRGELLFPGTRRILRGTTAERLEKLARRLIGKGLLRGVRRADIPMRGVRASAELLLCGTSIDVVAVTELDGRPIGDGHPGPVALALSRALRNDMRANPALRFTIS